MEFKAELAIEETSDNWKQALKLATVFGKKNEIVGVTDVVLEPQLMLHKLIKFVHVDIGE